MFEDAKKLETLEKEGQELYNQIVQEGKDNNQTVKEKTESSSEKIQLNEKKVLTKRKKKF